MKIAFNMRRIPAVLPLATNPPPVTHFVKSGGAAFQC